jgi:hypothetical protein
VVPTPPRGVGRWPRYGTKRVILGVFWHITGRNPTTRPPPGVGSVPLCSPRSQESNGTNPIAWGGRVVGLWDRDVWPEG